MTTIANLNRVITIRHLSNGQNEKGLPVKVLTTSQETYANFKQITNSYLLEQMQVTFGEAWQAVIRYEPGRIVQPNDQIFYNGFYYTINGIVNLDEGNLQWTKINCTMSNRTGTSADGQPVIIPSKEIHVKGNVTIGGANYAGWTGLIIAHRDGYQFTVRRDGSAVDKEINYDEVTGLFTYPVDLFPPQPNEPTDIYLL